MTLGTTIDFYLDLFHKAVRDSFAVKQWPIAAFAAIISTGLVVQGVIDTAFFLRPADSLKDALGILISSQLTVALIAVHGIMALETETILLALGGLLVAAVVLITLGLYAMQYVLSASRQPTTASFKQIMAPVSSLKSYRLFGIHALRRILSLLLVSAAVFPLSFLLGIEPFLSVIVFFAFFAVVLPIVFVIQSVAMKASYIISKSDSTMMESVGKAIDSLRRHWLSTLEFNVFLYAIVISLFVLSIFVGSQINLVLLLGLELLETFTSSLVATLITTGIYGVLLVIVWMLTGWVVLFVYNAWELYLKSIEASPLKTFTDHLVEIIKR